MARKPNAFSTAQRDARQALMNAAPLVGATPGVEELGIELTFSDPEGKQNPSPRGLTYGEGMRTYFYFTCPLRDCTGGGFDANSDLLPAVSKRRDGHTGTLTCAGIRPRGGSKNTPCGIALKYKLSIRMKTKVAA